ncbi:F-box/LRR-repeat protein At5g63520 [Malania oleifera]|uniref:F-box/LRR-repeat protein At5g63520 n=1 Tax=Malania oleifera TaxID=397392 RepID=UPI0025AE8302|nr:F-box/LRR-repeat protein At5g63520 [Malania oleifera]
MKKTIMEMGSGAFDLVTEDLLQNILSRLPALSFASAACVSRSWNHVCAYILSRPKLASALSLNRSQRDAVKEVIDKVLSEPIRPHFALACVGLRFSLETVHRLMMEGLGPRIPIITCSAHGVIGRDALTDEFKEVKWEMAYDDEDYNVADYDCNGELIGYGQGITLTIGFMPGLKVEAIPLLRHSKPPQVAMVDQFVMNIEDYAASVSGCRSPAAILICGGQHIDTKSVLDNLDAALSVETAIVGDPSSSFLYRSRDDARNVYGSVEYSSDAVAFVFARDRDKSRSIGEIQFHVELSSGLSPVGPLYKAASARAKGSDLSTWLTARREGLNEILDGQRILNDINDEMGDHIECPDLYIGVKERRKYSLGPGKVKLMTSLAFHEVLGGDEEYLFINGFGIRTGDFFRFYHSDSNAALSSCNNTSANLRNYVEGTASYGEKKEVFGGLLFSCCGRGESFFGCSNIDSSPFTENFPGVPVAGIFCGREIGRCSSSSIWKGSCEENARCCLHAYSTIYLVMSYTPPVSEH